MHPDEPKGGFHVTMSDLEQSMSDIGATMRDMGGAMSDPAAIAGYRGNNKKEPTLADELPGRMHMNYFPFFSSPNSIENGILRPLCVLALIQSTRSVVRFASLTASCQSSRVFMR